MTLSTRRDDIVFNYIIYVFESAGDSPYIVLSKKDTSNNLDTLSHAQHWNRIIEDSIYNLSIYSYDSLPELEVALRGRLSDIEGHYIYVEGKYPGGKNILFWSNGKIQVKTYYSNDIVGRFIKSKDY